MSARGQATRAFEAVRNLEPYRLWDMEVYSTLLWHLQHNMQLSFLAQELLARLRRLLRASVVEVSFHEPDGAHQPASEPAGVVTLTLDEDDRLEVGRRGLAPDDEVLEQVLAGGDVLRRRRERHVGDGGGRRGGLGLDQFAAREVQDC